MNSTSPNTRPDQSRLSASSARHNFLSAQGEANVAFGETSALFWSPAPWSEHAAWAPMRDEPERDNVDGWAYRNTKRGIDIMGAVAGLLVLFPVLLVISFLVWREDRGPVIFYQTRVGRNGVPFHFYKFRSMVPDAEALKHQCAAHNEAGDVIFKIKNDPRVTRIGRVLRRYSLDELPQFINVLRGEMSLVGPRPHLPREVAQYTDAQKPRLQAQPGLLCFREVQGRSNLSFEQWVQLDLQYIERRSLWVDACILLRAIPAILKADGAC